MGREERQEKEAGREASRRQAKAASGRAGSSKQFSESHFQSWSPAKYPGVQPCAKLLMHSIVSHFFSGESLADRSPDFQVKLNTGWGWGRVRPRCTASHRKLEEPSASSWSQTKPTKRLHSDSDYCQVDRLVPAGVEKLAEEEGVNLVFAGKVPS